MRAADCGLPPRNAEGCPWKAGDAAFRRSEPCGAVLPGRIPGQKPLKRVMGRWFRMKAKLVVVGGDVKATEINLKLPAIIGRGREATLTLPHPLVSRKHCELYEVDGTLMVRDLGSLNGTYVGTQRVVEAPLPSGELLTVATVNFRAVYFNADDDDTTIAVRRRRQRRQHARACWRETRRASAAIEPTRSTCRPRQRRPRHRSIRSSVIRSGGSAMRRHAAIRATAMILAHCSTICAETRLPRSESLAGSSSPPAAQEAAHERGSSSSRPGRTPCDEPPHRCSISLSPCTTFVGSLIIQ